MFLKECKVNKRKVRYIWVFLVLVFIGISCNTPASLTRKGDQLTATENYEEAVSYYYTALLKKKGFQPAISGLKFSAQKELDAKFKVFRELTLQNKPEDALKHYINTKQFADNAASVDAPLEWPTEYDEVYADIKQEVILKWFDEAIELINQRKFDIAERKFKEMAQVDTAYKRVSVLRMNTVLEPLFNEGMRQYNAGKFKTAYKTFTKIVAIDDGFKNVVEMKESARAKATERYALFPVVCKESLLKSTTQDVLKNMLKKQEGIFTEMLYPEQLNEKLASRGWGEFKETKDIITAGKAIGVDYVVYVSISTIKDTLMPKLSARRTAYEAFTENIPNPYTDTYSYITKFRKVEYGDVYESRILAYKAMVKLIDCKNAVTMLDDTISVARNDEIHRYECKCNPSNLFEELPQGNYLPPANKTWREQFTQPRQTLLSRDALSVDVVNELSNRISIKLKPFVK